MAENKNISASGVVTVTVGGTKYKMSLDMNALEALEMAFGEFNEMAADLIGEPTLGKTNRFLKIVADANNIESEMSFVPAGQMRIDEAPKAMTDLFNSLPVPEGADVDDEGKPEAANRKTKRAAASKKGKT